LASHGARVVAEATVFADAAADVPSCAEAGPETQTNRQAPKRIELRI
jgi:hypothetical protein